MYASVVSAASLSTKDFAKYQAKTIRQAEVAKRKQARDAKMSEPRSPQKIKPKEKLIGIYDAFFQGKDPSLENHNFWHEFFLLKVNAEYLESVIKNMTPSELMAVKDNINLVFAQCCLSLQAGDYPLKLVNALQTLCTLVRGIYHKKMMDYGFDIINILVGFDEAELQMKILVENLNVILVGESPVSLKNLSLKLLLILLTAADNVSQNTIVEYLMINSVFESIVKILASPVGRQQHGYEAIMLLTLLVNYRKYEASNPYIVKLSILDDDLALNGLGCIISDVLTDFNRKYTMKSEQPVGILSSISSIVGSMFVSEESSTASISVNNMVLLALYEAVHLNRHFFTVLSHVTTPNTHSASPPTTPTSPIPVVDRPSHVHVSDESVAQETSNLLVTFLTYSSIVMANVKGDDGASHAKLCFIILTCITEDQYANAFLHDINITFSVPLYKVHLYHRSGHPDVVPPSRPLACALLDLIVEFVVSHMTKNLHIDLYSKAFGIIHRTLCYQKRCRVRLAYSWGNLWTALMNFLKFILANETTLMSKVNIFNLAYKVVSIFNLFITYGDTFLPSPTCYDELYYEIIRVHQIFDNLYSMALRYSTNGTDGKQMKQCANTLAGSLVNIRAIINHFTPKIDSWAAVNHLSSLTSEQVLEVIRGNYDTLTLKLQDNLDNYEKYIEKPKESSFFTQLVRFITADVRQSIAVTNLEQFSLLKEFSSIN